MKFSVKKFQVELLTTNLSHRKKIVNFICLVLLSLFSFYITYRATALDTNTLFWQLKSFIGIAVAQSVAQISIGWYILKKIAALRNNKLPDNGAAVSVNLCHINRRGSRSIARSGIRPSKILCGAPLFHRSPCPSPFTAKQPRS